MSRISKVIIAFTLLAGILMVAFALIINPTAEEEELETTTVTLGTCRDAFVGYGRRGRRITTVIFKASDGEEYNVAGFYKDEAKELSGHTVSIRYLENGSSFDGVHMIVELSEGDMTHYTLEDWNKSQRSFVWVALMVWGVFAFIALLYVLGDVFGIFSRANRHRRRARQKEARAERLAELKNRPRNFPNTTWETEDGKLTVTVDEEGRAAGIIRVPEGDATRSIPVIFDDTAHTTIRMAPYESGKRAGKYIEIWEADYDAPDGFTAKPLKTTYFKKGKTVTVRRVDRLDRLDGERM